jgi:hypothetical protein
MRSLIMKLPLITVLLAPLSCTKGEPNIPASSGRAIIVDGRHSFLPDSGFIPDSLTAVAVAEAVLIPVHGRASVERQRPLAARQEGGIWIVEGAMREGFLGGVARVELSRADGRITRMSHGQ